MKRKILAITLSVIGIAPSHAQTLYLNGGTLHIAAGGSVNVNGDAQIQSGSTRTNLGTFYVSGQFTNHAASTPEGTIVFDGNTLQTLDGSTPFQARDVLVNNPSGITLNTPLVTDGTITFDNGILTSSVTSPLVFKAEAEYSGASDNSHVKGYVVREGSGAFTFPVGNGAKLQPVAVNLTENSHGLQARYLGDDAGTAPFGTSGASATALEAYNNQEYWDLAPVGTGTAQGTVTIFWDDFNNPEITSSEDLRAFKVAHRIDGEWQNEGGTPTGSLTAGSVTSELISTWSPFALGAIPESALPVKWLSFNSYLNDQGRPVLVWKVDEKQVASYEVQRSANGRNFESTIQVKARGDGVHSYTHTDETSTAGSPYYRIKQTDEDGSVSFSRLLKVQNTVQTLSTAWPNPVAQATTVSVDPSLVGTRARLFSPNGTLIKQQAIHTQSFRLELDGLPSGMYFLRTQDGRSVKIVKE
jgi:hypothetical protein